MTKRNRTILVLGATGQQGGATARELLARGFDVRALVRDPDKAEARALRDRGAALVRGDLEAPASLREAMRGAHGVFSVQAFSQTDASLEVRQGIHVADLAKETGIAHVVYSSVGGAERSTGIAHFDSKWRIEEHLRGLGVPLTVLRPVFFMENFASFNGPALVDGSLVLRMALRPETRLQVVAVRDIAVFAANAFEQPDFYLGRAIELAGDALTMTELASTFQRATGIPTRFESQPTAQLRAFSEELASMFEWFDAKGYAADIPALRGLYPGLTTLETWLRDTGWKP
ncbi:NmrA/HSCARG family protein [Pendulispora albinea]|uniref:NmrA/HSCARG family protein n=1 Tax=Pendulispora albinea TaxID=2741071 RepID=A0ABZ2LTR2_9BACT